MAQNDIYRSQEKYQRFIAHLDRLVVKPKTGDYRRKYWCKNKANLHHFLILDHQFGNGDTSYVRLTDEILYLAMLRAAAERSSDALVLLEVHRELAQDDHHRFLWYQLTAAIHRGLSNPQAATCLIAEFEPSDESLQKKKLWVNHYIDLGDYASARPFAIQIAEAERSPDSLDVAYRVLERLKDWAACEGYAQRLVAEIPIGGTYLMLAQSQHNGGNCREAIQTVETVPTDCEFPHSIELSGKVTGTRQKSGSEGF